MTPETDLNPPHGSEVIRAGLNQHTVMKIPKNTIEGSTENHSPFTELPQEIKREIYLLLMGNREVYITVQGVRRRSSNGRFSKGMVRVGKETGFWELICNSLFPINYCAQPSKENKVYLRVLRASKQNYYEARLLPYTHNTFHMEVGTLCYFMKGRISYQKESLRSLSLKMNILMTPLPEILMFSAARSLTGLRRFMMLIDVDLVSDTDDLTCCTEEMKVLGTKGVDKAQVTVEGDLFSLFSARKLERMKEIAGELSKLLWDRNPVEEGRQIVMKARGRLAKRYQNELLKLLGIDKA